MPKESWQTTPTSIFDILFVVDKSAISDNGLLKGALINSEVSPLYNTTSVFADHTVGIYFIFLYPAGILSAKFVSKCT